MAESVTTPQQTRDRLLRVIRGLQLLQRTNAPKSSISKAAAKALVPLLEEMENHPVETVPAPAPAAGS
jgi:hypothetical protein